MSYLISITVPDSQLQAVLKGLDGRKATVEYVHDALRLQGPDNGAQDGKRPVGRIPMTAFLSMGSKSPRKGTNYEVVVKTLQKMEVKHGPHKVTRGMLRDELYKNDDIADWVCNEGIVHSVRDGYLEVS